MFKWSESDKIAIPITLTIIIVLAIILNFTLKNKSEKIKKLPLQILALIVVVLEFGKQFYFIVLDTYELYALPIHFCTLILVLMALSQFLPSKIAKFFKAPAFVFSIIVFALVLVHPSSMIGKATSNIFGNFKNFHTFTFHFTVIAYPIFSIALSNYKPRLKDCINICCTVVFYATYAVPLAFHFKANYVNILYSFFEPLENFRLSAGQVAYDILLFLIGISAGCLVLIIYWSIDKLILKIKEKKHA